ncbi:hypothetical protein KM043_008798 [Ampulex compressa]|nr:hypothetical protein KM043_008798 [Ampulex compressa]
MEQRVASRRSSVASSSRNSRRWKNGRGKGQNGGPRRNREGSGYRCELRRQGGQSGGGSGRRGREERRSVQRIGGRGNAERGKTTNNDRTPITMSFLSMEKDRSSREHWSSSLGARLVPRISFFPESYAGAVALLARIAPRKNPRFSPVKIPVALFGPDMWVDTRDSLTPTRCRPPRGEGCSPAALRRQVPARWKGRAMARARAREREEEEEEGVAGGEERGRGKEENGASGSLAWHPSSGRGGAPAAALAAASHRAPPARGAHPEPPGGPPTQTVGPRARWDRRQTSSLAATRLERLETILPSDSGQRVPWTELLPRRAPVRGYEQRRSLGRSSGRELEGETYLAPDSSERLPRGTSNRETGGYLVQRDSEEGKTPERRIGARCSREAVEG